MESAMRSLIEPPGFWFSSLRNSWQRPRSRRVASIMGVLPIRSRTEGIDYYGSMYLAKQGFLPRLGEDSPALRDGCTLPAEGGFQCLLLRRQRGLSKSFRT